MLKLNQGLHFLMFLLNSSNKTKIMIFFRVQLTSALGFTSLVNPGSATELDHSNVTAVQATVHIITLNIYMFSSIFSCALHNLTTLNLQCSVPFHHLVFEASSNVINLRKTTGFQRYPVTFNQSPASLPHIHIITLICISYVCI